ncbi:hypothetical protein JHK85_010552 [Glycine max]|nr:hypothetical protein JHK85_010552 [Glycine max]
MCTKESYPTLVVMNQRTSLNQMEVVQEFICPSEAQGDPIYLNHRFPVFTVTGVM